MRPAHFLQAAILSVVFLALARAAEPAINDRADFFSAEAEEKAQQKLIELKRSHNVEVLIESFETVPAGQVERVKAMTERDRGEFFADWLKQLAKERSAKGLFILICREPSHLRIGVSKELHERGFTDAHREKITQGLLSALKRKEYDEGLLNALDAIETVASTDLKAAGASTTAKTRTSPAAAGDSSLPSWTGWLCLGIGGLVAVLVVVSLVGALFRGGGAGAPGYGGMGGGWGGGLFGSLFAGLGGALLGNWIYDQWAGGSAHANEPGAGANDASGGATDDNYQDFSSSGGDFGDTGGGDFGGGDFGGGDFGGGDGGGDF